MFADHLTYVIGAQEQADLRRLVGYPRPEWQKCCVAWRHRAQSSLPDSGASESLPGSALWHCWPCGGVHARLTAGAQEGAGFAGFFWKAREIWLSTRVDANACRWLCFGIADATETQISSRAERVAGRSKPATGAFKQSI